MRFTFFCGPANPPTVTSRASSFLISFLFRPPTYLAYLCPIRKSPVPRACLLTLTCNIHRHKEVRDCPEEEGNSTNTDPLGTLQGFIKELYLVMFLRTKPSINTMYLVYLFVISYGLCSCIVIFSSHFKISLFTPLKITGSESSHFCVVRKTATKQNVLTHPLFNGHGYFLYLYLLRVGLSMNGLSQELFASYSHYCTTGSCPAHLQSHTTSH